MRENIKFIAGICRLAGGVDSCLMISTLTSLPPSRADESGRVDDIALQCLLSVTVST